MKTPERISLLSRLAASVITVTFVTVLIAAYSMALAAPASQELVQRGAYLALAGDCIACHTAREGQSFAAGLLLNTPIGMIYSTNITPDLETGIGRYSMDDFVKAHTRRRGEGRAPPLSGHALYVLRPVPRGRPLPLLPTSCRAWSRWVIPIARRN